MLETKEIAIIAAYYAPNHTALDIIEELRQLILQQNKKPIIITEDFNCRIDVDNYKAKLVTEKIRDEGFTQLNDNKTPTYICHNGKSTIDLAFSRGIVNGKISPLWAEMITPIQKHLPMKINSHLQTKEIKKEHKLTHIRKIQEQKIEASRAEIRRAEAVKILEDILNGVRP